MQGDAVTGNTSGGEGPAGTGHSLERPGLMARPGPSLLVPHRVRLPVFVSCGPSPRGILTPPPSRRCLCFPAPGEATRMEAFPPGTRRPPGVLLSL